MRPASLGRAPRMDLHCHTDRSDGRYPPEEVVARACQHGLEVLALTDHDLPPPLPSGERQVGDHHIRILAGTEVSGTHEGREYHLLVFFPGEMPADFAAWLRERAASRARRYDAALDALGLAHLERADARAHAGERALTRHHLARALLDSGTAATFSEAMRRLTERPIVPLIDVAYLDAIRIARDAGGLTSWAHPPLADANRLVATFAAAGLEALEAFKPKVDRPTRNGLKRLATKHGLLLTGGTDWHGWLDGPLGLFSITDEHAWPFLRRLEGPRAPRTTGPG